MGLLTKEIPTSQLCIFGKNTSHSHVLSSNKQTIPCLIFHAAHRVSFSLCDVLRGKGKIINRFLICTNISITFHFPGRCPVERINEICCFSSAFRYCVKKRGTGQTKQGDHNQVETNWGGTEGDPLMRYNYSIGNLSAFHYSNLQQLISNQQLKINHQHFRWGFTKNFFVIVVVENKKIPFFLLDCAWKKGLIKTFDHAID